MPDRHRQNPLSIRLGDLQQRVEDYAKLHGIAVRRVIVDAVREKLDREEGGDGGTSASG